MNTVDRINWAMSLREPQCDALCCFAHISEQLEYKVATKAEAEQVASMQCQNPHTIQIAKEFDFPSFCFSMATGILHPAALPCGKMTAFSPTSARN